MKLSSKNLTKYISLFLTCFVLSCSTFGENKMNSLKVVGLTKPKKFKSSERVVVYYPWWAWEKWENRKSDLEKVTHIIIAFANPDKKGDLYIKHFDPEKLIKLVNAAHSKGVRVLISIGGGKGPNYSKILAKSSVDGFCQKIMEYIDKYKLDGLDVDIEGNMIVEAQYKAFIAKISPMLKKEDKLLTSAVGWYRRERIKKETLVLFDFVNVMAYDEKGSWAPNNPGQHSSVSWGKKNLDYWHKLGVSKEKLVLGVPFYGKDFTDSKNVHSLSYKDILAKHPDAHSKDKIGLLYYNGKATIKEKCGIARKYGGIMVWEISQDSNDKHSLLDVIHENIKK